MHFLHKTIPGTSNNIAPCAKFYSSSCLVSWLPKIRSCSLANWESTFFSQNLALLNISFTVHKLYTWLTHPKQLCGMPDMSLVSLTGFWCPWQRGNNQTDLCETTRHSSPLCSTSQILIVTEVMESLLSVLWKINSVKIRNKVNYFFTNCDNNITYEIQHTAYHYNIKGKYLYLW